MDTATTFTAFAGNRRLSSGALPDVALKVKQRLEREPTATVLVFDDRTGRTVDLDLRGDYETVRRRLLSEPTHPTPSVPAVKAGPGRPRLGVVSREISLLPRHWEWLGMQPGGASVTLRRLVDEARKKNQGSDRERLAQEATYQFMRVMAGDLPGYEEALRALYARESKKFRRLVGEWPVDVRSHIERLASPAFARRPAKEATAG